MKAVTGMANPEKDLGLAVDAFTRFRFQGVGFLGISGTLALLVAGVPGPWRSIGVTDEMLAGYGYLTLFVNIGFSVFASQLEKWNMKRIVEANGVRSRENVSMEN